MKVRKLTTFIASFFVRDQEANKGEGMGASIHSCIFLYTSNFLTCQFSDVNSFHQWLTFPNISTVEQFHYEYVSVSKITPYTVPMCTCTHSLLVILMGETNEERNDDEQN